MAKLKFLLLSLLACMFMLAPTGQAHAFNLFKNDTCTATKTVNGKQVQNSACNQAQTQTGTNPVLRFVNDAANIIALIAGVASIILIIISGFTMVTSGGNAEDIKAARSRIINAIVGLILISLAWAIARLVADGLIKS